MKKRNSVITILLATVLLLCGCGRSTTEDLPEDTQAQEPVTISYGLWGGDERQEYTLKQIEAFEERYPYITVDVNYTDWSTLKKEIDGIMEAGTESDVMQINYNWLAKYSEDGTGFYDLYELSDFIEFDAYSDLSLTYGLIDGKMNALAIAMNTSVPVYNQTLYDAYHLDPPDSMEELRKNASIMQADGIYQLGMQDSQLLLFLCGCYENTYGVSVADADGKFKLTDGGYTYLANLYKNYTQNHIICPRSEYSDAMLAGEKVAGEVCWINSIEAYEEIITNNGNQAVVGSFLWTNLNERLGNYVKPSTMLAISAHTEHPEEAAMLLNFLLNDEEAVTLQGVEKGVPDSRFAQQELMEAGDLNNDVFYTTLHLNYYMEYMHVLPGCLEDGEIVTAFLDQLDAYADGSSSLDETVAALKEICEE